MSPDMSLVRTRILAAIPRESSDHAYKRQMPLAAFTELELSPSRVGSSPDPYSPTSSTNLPVEGHDIDRERVLTWRELLLRIGNSDRRPSVAALP
jgi:hypothetical protein